MDLGSRGIAERILNRTRVGHDGDDSGHKIQTELDSHHDVPNQSLVTCYLEGECPAVTSIGSAVSKAKRETRTRGLAPRICMNFA
jgi:hypothetical protein